MVILFLVFLTDPRICFTSPEVIGSCNSTCFDCVPGLSTFTSARREVQQLTGFTIDVVHCCELELATTAVEAALKTAAHLAASSNLQDALLKAGIIWSVQLPC